MYVDSSEMRCWFSFLSCQCVTVSFDMSIRWAVNWCSMWPGVKPLWRERWFRSSQLTGSVKILQQIKQITTRIGRVYAESIWTGRGGWGRERKREWERETGRQTDRDWDRTERETDRQTDRDWDRTDRQTNRHIEIETGRNRDRQTDREYEK